MLKKLRYFIPLILLIVSGAVSLTGIFEAPNNIVYDNVLASQRASAGNIVIVAFDERSYMEIGTWPWPRFFVADAITKVAEMGAAAIGVNVFYDAYSTQESDDALVGAASSTDRLVLGAVGIISEHMYGGELSIEDYIHPFDELDAVTQVGFLNAESDNDGVMRNALTALRYGDIRVFSLAYETYKTYCRVMGLAVNEPPLNSHGQFPINYVSGPGGFTTVSLWGVINDEYDPAIFEDAIVLMGAYTQGIGDTGFPTPLYKRAPTYSVEINANIIQNMLEGDFKYHAHWWQDILILLVSGIVLTFLLPRLRPAPGALVTVGLIAAQLAAAWVFHAQLGIIVNVAEGIIYLILCLLANMILGIIAAQQENRHIEGLFGRFVSPDIVKEMVAGNIEVQLGGAEKEITVLFVDIRGFTAFSEKNPAAKVVSMVNRYLALTSESVQKNGGTIDKYIGDATMAVFNAPNDLPNHALCAVRAAWAMKIGSETLREEILKDYGVDLQFGVGINTGQAVVGNMGCDFRMDYTAIGDTVNTAARLESNSQKGQIIISEATYNQVKDHVEVTDLGVLNVKNKEIGIQIYNVDKVLGYEHE